MAIKMLRYFNPVHLNTLKIYSTVFAYDIHLQNDWWSDNTLCYHNII